MAPKERQGKEKATTSQKGKKRGRKEQGEPSSLQTPRLTLGIKWDTYEELLRMTTLMMIPMQGPNELLSIAMSLLFVANTVDLNGLALSVYGEEVYGKMGLKRMAKEVLGKVMEKPLNVALSEWDAEELVYEQVEYAAIDKLLCPLKLGKNCSI
ncbi:hypothetical protein CQW23_18914 [Capsicum baccatum]|uniref:3'-5' exonuclease domain-containing protein n=1 Tax=Capsicum baccatum TaxID=33114 RepID=A0A2G2W4A1_CAPBA|nr:hypothetical protein CQW23_18914 [Capsicum baccatum]